MPPSSPTNLATSNSPQRGVQLTWTASGSGSPVSYTVQRQLGVGGATVGLATVSAISYLDADVTTGGVYVYSIVANGADGTTSAASASVRHTYTGPANPYKDAEGGRGESKASLTVFNGVVRNGGGEWARMQRLRGLTTTYLS